MSSTGNYFVLNNKCQYETKLTNNRNMSLLVGNFFPPMKFFRESHELKLTGEKGAGQVCRGSLNIGKGNILIGATTVQLEFLPIRDKDEAWVPEPVDEHNTIEERKAAVAGLFDDTTGEYTEETVDSFSVEKSTQDRRLGHTAHYVENLAHSALASCVVCWSSFNLHSDRGDWLRFKQYLDGTVHKSGRNVGSYNDPDLVAAYSKIKQVLNLKMSPFFGKEGSRLPISRLRPTDKNPLEVVLSLAPLKTIYCSTSGTTPWLLHEAKPLEDKHVSPKVFVDTYHVSKEDQHTIDTTPIAIYFTQPQSIEKKVSRKHTIMFDPVKIRVESKAPITDIYIMVLASELASSKDYHNYHGRPMQVENAILEREPITSIGIKHADKSDVISSRHSSFFRYSNTEESHENPDFSMPYYTYSFREGKDPEKCSGFLPGDSPIDIEMILDPRLGDCTVKVFYKTANVLTVDEKGKVDFLFDQASNM